MKRNREGEEVELEKPPSKAAPGVGYWEKQRLCGRKKYRKNYSEREW